MADTRRSVALQERVDHFRVSPPQPPELGPVEKPEEGARLSSDQTFSSDTGSADGGGGIESPTPSTSEPGVTMFPPPRPKVRPVLRCTPAPVGTGFRVGSAAGSRSPTLRDSGRPRFAAAPTVASPSPHRSVTTSTGCTKSASPDGCGSAASKHIDGSGRTCSDARPTRRDATSSASSTCLWIAICWAGRWSPTVSPMAKSAPCPRLRTAGPQSAQSATMLRPELQADLGRDPHEIIREALRSVAERRGGGYRINAGSPLTRGDLRRCQES